MSRRDCPLDCKVYVGGLPERASRSELEALFSRYGPLRNVWVARRPPGFAFVEFEDTRDAEDACRALDGTRMCGVRARVELSSGKRRNRGGPPGYGGPMGGGDRGGGGRYDNGDRGRGGRSPPVRRPARNDSRSRSRSPLPRGGGGRSPARSYSRSPPPRNNYNRSPNGSPAASRN